MWRPYLEKGTYLPDTCRGTTTFSTYTSFYPAAHRHYLPTSPTWHRIGPMRSGGPPKRAPAKPLYIFLFPQNQNFLLGVIKKNTHIRSTPSNNHLPPAATAVGWQREVWLVDFCDSTEAPFPALDMEGGVHRDDPPECAVPNGFLGCSVYVVVVVVVVYEEPC